MCYAVRNQNANDENATNRNTLFSTLLTENNEFIVKEE